mgnify:CR=1 FL=1
MFRSCLGGVDPSRAVVDPRWRVKSLVSESVPDSERSGPAPPPMSRREFGDVAIREVSGVCEMIIGTQS